MGYDEQAGEPVVDSR